MRRGTSEGEKSREKGEEERAFGLVFLQSARTPVERSESSSCEVVTTEPFAWSEGTLRAREKIPGDERTNDRPFSALQDAREIPCVEVISDAPFAVPNVDVGEARTEDISTRTVLAVWCEACYPSLSSDRTTIPSKGCRNRRVSCSSYTTDALFPVLL